MSACKSIDETNKKTIDVENNRLAMAYLFAFLVSSSEFGFGVFEFLLLLFDFHFEYLFHFSLHFLHFHVVFALFFFHLGQWIPAAGVNKRRMKKRNTNELACQLLTIEYCQLKSILLTPKLYIPLFNLFFTFFFAASSSVCVYVPLIGFYPDRQWQWQWVVKERESVWERERER